MENLAAHTLNAALDNDDQAIARRGGVIYTDKVTRRTTLFLLRYRFHILTQIGQKERSLLVEDSEVVGFEGAPAEAAWDIPPAYIEELLAAAPRQNIDRERASHFLRLVIEAMAAIYPTLEKFSHERGQRLLDAHRRVRSAAHWTGVKQYIRPELPPDVLGIYVYLPAQVNAA